MRLEIFLFLILFSPLAFAQVDDPELFSVTFDSPNEWEFVCLPKGVHFEDSSTLTKDNITGLKKVDGRDNLAFVRVDTAGIIEGFSHLNTTYSELDSGRNTVCASPHVVGRSFNEFSGSCDLTRAVYFENGDWTDFSLDTVITNDLVGRGFAVFADNDCSFDGIGDDVGVKFPLVVIVNADAAELELTSLEVLDENDQVLLSDVSIDYTNKYGVPAGVYKVRVEGIDFELSRKVNLINSGKRVVFIVPRVSEDFDKPRVIEAEPGRPDITLEEAYDQKVKEREEELERRHYIDVPGVVRPALAVTTVHEEHVKLPPLEGQPILGDPNAPNVIVEFCDLKGPFCGRFHTQTLPLLKEKFIDSGRAKLVFFNYPLAFHEGAFDAAAVGECIYREGGDEFFWEYIEFVYENPGLTVDQLLEEYEENFVRNVYNRDIDYSSVAGCFPPRDDFFELVERDIDIGERVGVRGTPYFIVNGRVIQGAQPFEVFVDALESGFEIPSVAPPEYDYGKDCVYVKPGYYQPCELYDGFAGDVTTTTATAGGVVVTTATTVEGGSDVGVPTVAYPVEYPRFHRLGAFVDGVCKEICVETIPVRPEPVFGEVIVIVDEPVCAGMGYDEAYACCKNYIYESGLEFPACDGELRVENGSCTWACYDTITPQPDYPYPTTEVRVCVYPPEYEDYEKCGTGGDPTGAYPITSTLGVEYVDGVIIDGECISVCQDYYGGTTQTAPGYDPISGTTQIEPYTTAGHDPYAACEGLAQEDCLGKWAIDVTADGSTSCRWVCDRYGDQTDTIVDTSATATGIITSIDTPNNIIRIRSTNDVESVIESITIASRYGTEIAMISTCNNLVLYPGGTLELNSDNCPNLNISSDQDVFVWGSNNFRVASKS